MCSENQRKGERCRICIGCGCCPDVERKLHILTTEADGPDVWAIPIRSDRGERLVTADIGTTTIAMQLYAPDGTVEEEFVRLNPQSAYGADVLSRIQAAKNSEDAKRMQEMVQGVLREGVHHFQGRISAGENLRMVLTANTTMVYLLMGWNTAELGEAPFSASHLDAVETLIEDVPCYIFPGISAFVGGDIVAGILACKMQDRKEITLLIDLGTNGEMALGNDEKIVVCSTAAGPAFEGGVNRGVWGSDMISLLATLRREQILDETGLLDDPYFETGVRIGNVCVTQESVRAVQLAKGAIAAGIRILLREYGITEEQVDRVVLAGGFGYYLNPVAAAQIGLLPDGLATKTITGGNTALAGALCLGREELNGDENLRHKIQKDMRRLTTVLNLAATEGFEELYIASMGL